MLVVLTVILWSLVKKRFISYMLSTKTWKSITLRNYISSINVDISNLQELMNKGGR